MLNALHSADDIAADHRRTLRAEADAYRLARRTRTAASPAGTPPSRVRRPMFRRAVVRPA